MTLNADTLLDRNRLKALVTKWRLVAIAAVVLLLLVSLNKNSSGSNVIQGDFIARLTIDGIITDDTKRDELIRKLRDNSNAKAVIVWLDTPGGTAVGGQEIYLQLRELSKTKPVVAVMRTMATSAGYMVALGTDQIFAREGTITGSIGVIMEMAEFTELAEKLGIKPIIIKSGPLKGSPSPAEKFTEESNAMVSSVIKDFFEVFVNMVAERRKLPLETAFVLSDGRIYSGRQAVENKLIDAIGGEQDAKAWLVKNRQIPASLEIKDVEVEKDVKSLIDKLTGAFGGSAIANMLIKLDGLALIWQPNGI